MMSKSFESFLYALDGLFVDRSKKTLEEATGIADVGEALDKLKFAVKRLEEVVPEEHQEDLSKITHNNERALNFVANYVYRCGFRDGQNMQMALLMQREEL